MIRLGSTSPALELSVGHLRDLRAAIEELGDRPGRYVYDDFIIHHLDASDAAMP